MLSIFRYRYGARAQHHRHVPNCAPWNDGAFAAAQPLGQWPFDTQEQSSDDGCGAQDIEINDASDINDASEINDASVDVEINDEDLAQYVDALCEAGTYDPKFVSRHVDRGVRNDMSESVLVACRFLRATETGEGCSRRQVEGWLAFARTLGVRGKMLPRGYKQLWDCVEKVCACLYV